jgi:hypothetical protein
MYMSKIKKEWLLYIMVKNYSDSLFVKWINCVLFIASRCRHKDIVEILLSKGADVNVSNYHGMTALHLGEWIFNIINIRWINFWFAASVNGHLDIVEYLFSKAADVNAKDKNGMTALHYGE